MWHGKHPLRCRMRWSVVRLPCLALEQVKAGAGGRALCRGLNNYQYHLEYLFMHIYV